MILPYLLLGASPCSLCWGTLSLLFLFALTQLVLTGKSWGTLVSLTVIAQMLEKIYITPKLLENYDSLI